MKRADPILAEVLEVFDLSEEELKILTELIALWRDPKSDAYGRRFQEVDEEGRLYVLQALRMYQQRFGRLLGKIVEEGDVQAFLEMFLGGS